MATLPKTKWFILPLIVFGCLPVAAAEGSGGDPGSQFAAHVERLLAEMTATTYQGTTEIDEEAGVLNCDCSRHFCDRGPSYPRLAGSDL